MRKPLVDRVVDLGACDAGKAWLYGLPSPVPAAVLYEHCPQAEWLLWFLAASGQKRNTVAAAAACARLVLPILDEVQREGVPCRELADELDAWVRGAANETKMLDLAAFVRQGLFRIPKTLALYRALRCVVNAAQTVFEGVDDLLSVCAVHTAYDARASGITDADLLAVIHTAVPWSKLNGTVWASL